MKIKLGRNYVTLQEGDYILDNGACLQIKTKDKSAEVWEGWHKYNPKLSKKEFNRFLKEAKYKLIEKQGFLKYYIYIGIKNGKK